MGGSSLEPFDILVAIDTSASTRVASGLDIDGDGEIGETSIAFRSRVPDLAADDWSSDPDDSILAAEVGAVCAWLGRDRSRNYRVGLLTFAGAVDPRTREQLGDPTLDAEVVVPLTDRVEDLTAGLAAILERGGSGATNFTAALDLATRELGSDASALSEVRTPARRIVLLITDGAPTLPVGKGTVMDQADIELAIEAAGKAGALGIRIHTYAVGPGAITYPTAVVRIAEVSGGRFLPLVSPARIFSHFGTALSDQEGGE
jgi:hypothetical protein